jgi:hypothetical protein
MAENKPRIPEDDFVSKIVKDPKQPPDAMLLSGYIGKSSEADHVRLYFDPELRNYVEIPSDAILHTQAASTEGSTLGGSHVWIKRDAEVIHGKVGPQRTKSKFFEGPIAAAGVGGTGVAGFSTALPTCPTHAPTACACPSQIVVQCPHPTAFCPSRVLNCPPSANPVDCPIQTAFCPSPVLQCPPHTPLCPSPVVHCPPSAIPVQCPIQTAFCPSPVLHCPPHTPLCPSVGLCFTPTCPTAVLQCPPHTPLCPTVGTCFTPTCPTAICHTPLCPSVGIPCQTNFACPSALGCPSGPACGGGPEFGGGGTPVR